VTAPALRVPNARGHHAIIGSSAAMSRLRRQIVLVARVSSNILITGATGTGKELVAWAIHLESARSARKFVCVNCAALPEELFESELFGHERGAFTGAYRSRAGLLEGSDGGTVFLDEVGELSLFAQAKLLRVIENKEVQRLGDTRACPVDFRVLAATNRDLERMVDEGQFRRDLFHRLNVARIHIPPLRERKDDLPELVSHYVAVLNEEFGCNMTGVDSEVLGCLLDYAWLGNVRELRNLLEAAYVNAAGPLITRGDLPEQFLSRSGAPSSERQRLISALASVNWNKSKAAVQMRWSRMTLYRKLAKYGISDADKK
jgi:transcriptional regulator with GAF, ATPase, and Fis domain